MAQTRAFNERVQRIGQQIFEFAEASKPRPWEKAWWLEQMTRYVEQDDGLKSHAFQFVECLPSLHTDAALSRHLREYLGPVKVGLPPVFHSLIAPGPMQASREWAIANGARFGATLMAGRFIAGTDGPTALKTIERLRRAGMTFTVDVLGESTNSFAQADRYADAYIELIKAISPAVDGWPEVPRLDREAIGPMPRANFSVKLTSLDPHFDAIDPQRVISEVGRRLRPIFRLAREHGAFVNIDMEHFRVRDLTLELFKQILMEEEFRDWPDVGIVVQAYLQDGENDLDGLLAWGRRRGTRFGVRLVKGAYWDAETAMAIRNHKSPPVWTRKWESDACYERMTRTMLSHTDLLRPAFASHNVRTVAAVMVTAEELGLGTDAYELQTLYGMGDPLKAALVRTGACVRVYLPCGALMPGMGYLIRRLLENTSNDGFLKQAFGDRASHDALLADPAIAQPPSAALPTRHYQNHDPEEPMSDFVNASNTNFSHPANRDRMLAALQRVHDEAGTTYPLLIGQEEVRKAASYRDSRNPSQRDEIIGKLPVATAADADRAVVAARRAFASWRTTTARERAHLLRKLADAMEEQRLDLAATMVLECGKPWREADADVTEAIDHSRYYAEQIEQTESRPRKRNVPGEDNVLVYSPKGVSVVISPWSFPLAILTGMTTASLAAGNTVIIKPAPQAAVAASKLLALMRGVGVPAGVVNFLADQDGEVAAHLVDHPDVNLVAFTGASDTGVGVLKAGATVHANQTYIKKLIVEMGGKNAIIVDDDADLDGATMAVIQSAFTHAGQKCSSCARAIVLDDAYDEFCRRLAAAAEAIIIGPAEQASTMVGPIIDEESAQRVRAFADLGKQEANVLYEGKLPPEAQGGFFVAPLILEGVKPDVRVALEEVFGPVLCVIRANDFDEAIDIANRPRYALTGGLFSRSPSHIEQARRDFAVGNLYINRKIIGSQVDVQPFGGFKFSGTGVKAGSPEYLHHFMDARCITENTLRSGLVPEEEEEHAEVH